MIKKIVLILTSTLTVVLLLMIISKKAFTTDNRKNGFIRLFSEKAEISSISPTGKNAITLIGTSNDTIFLNSGKPDEIISKVQNRNKLDKIKIPIDSNSLRQLYHSYRCDLHYPYLSIYSFNSAKILRVNLKTKRITTIGIPGNYINSLQLNDSEYIAQCYNGSSTTSNFVKINIHQRKFKSENDHLENHTSPRDLNSGGILLDYKRGKEIVYIHRYSNKIEIFDYNLKQKKGFTTIDTFSISTINFTGKNTKDSSLVFKPNTPPIMINRLAKIDEHNLYVYSKVKSNNETTNEFKNKLVFDIYDLQKRKYKGSFYAQKVNGSSISSFIISNNQLTTTNKEKIISYQIK